MYEYSGSKISREFVNEIAGYGLRVPSTNQVCRKTLLFVNFGNPVFKRTREERIKFLKDLQDEWLDQKVIGKSQNQPGVVVAVVPYTEHDILQYFKEFRKPCQTSYQLLVRWEGAKSGRLISPDYVTKAEQSP